jgi:histidine ammonia-lyase
LEIVDNAGRIVAIELLAAAQAYDLQSIDAPRAPHTDSLWQRIRRAVPTYRDDRPLADDMTIAFRIIADETPPPLPNPGTIRPGPEASVNGAGLAALASVTSVGAAGKLGADAAANDGLATAHAG